MKSGRCVLVDEFVKSEKFEYYQSAFRDGRHGEPTHRETFRPILIPLPRYTALTALAHSIFQPCISTLSKHRTQPDDTVSKDIW